MTPEEDKEQLNGMCDHLIDKKEIFLRVEVKNREEANQILDWMFSGDNKPMLAHLSEIAWDKEMVSKKDADAIRRRLG